MPVHRTGVPDAATGGPLTDIEHLSLVCQCPAWDTARTQPQTGEGLLGGPLAPGYCARERSAGHRRQALGGRPRKRVVDWIGDGFAD